jgi:hypothetical protein
MYVARKMKVWEKVMCAFIIVVTGLYVYDISKLTIQSMNEAVPCQMVCKKASP